MNVSEKSANKQNNFAQLDANLKSKGIYAMTGDCICFASALQKINDPSGTKSFIECSLKKPYGIIGHCMFRDSESDTFVDIEGTYNFYDAWEKLNSFSDCDMIDDDGEYYLDQDCISTYYWKDKSIKNLCNDKIDIIEKELKNNPIALL